MIFNKTTISLTGKYHIERIKRKYFSFELNPNFNSINDLQNKNSKLRALISNNFGRRKNDPAKDRKALETYVELKGYKNGEHGDKLCQNGTAKSTLNFSL